MGQGPQHDAAPDMSRPCAVYNLKECSSREAKAVLAMASPRRALVMSALDPLDPLFVDVGPSQRVDRALSTLSTEGGSEAGARPVMPSVVNVQRALVVGELSPNSSRLPHPEEGREAEGEGEGEGEEGEITPASRSESTPSTPESKQYSPILAGSPSSAPTSTLSSSLPSPSISKHPESAPTFPPFELRPDGQTSCSPSVAVVSTPLLASSSLASIKTPEEVHPLVSEWCDEAGAQLLGDLEYAAALVGVLFALFDADEAMATGMDAVMMADKVVQEQAGQVSAALNVLLAKTQSGRSALISHCSCNGTSPCFTAQRRGVEVLYLGDESFVCMLAYAILEQGESDDRAGALAMHGGGALPQVSECQKIVQEARFWGLLGERCVCLLSEIVYVK